MSFTMRTCLLKGVSSYTQYTISQPRYRCRPIQYSLSHGTIPVAYIGVVNFQIFNLLVVKCARRSDNDDGK